MTIDQTDGAVLVVGGTGKTGRRVVDRLQARAVPVRVGSRSASASGAGQARFDGEELTGIGEPDEEVGLLRYLFGEVLDGRNAHTADGVEQALGRPARDFGDHVRATVGTGVWSGLPGVRHA